MSSLHHAQRSKICLGALLALPVGWCTGHTWPSLVQMVWLILEFTHELHQNPVWAPIPAYQEYSLPSNTGSVNTIMWVYQCDITVNYLYYTHLHIHHLQHFQEDAELASKLELLLEHAYKSPLLTMNEKNAAVEASSMYSLQKGATEEHSLVIEYMSHHSPVHMVRGRERVWDKDLNLCLIIVTLLSPRSHLSVCYCGHQRRRLNSFASLRTHSFQE